jgi:hypothetical protein
MINTGFNGYRPDFKETKIPLTPLKHLLKVIFSLVELPQAQKIEDIMKKKGVKRVF